MRVQLYLLQSDRVLRSTEDWPALPQVGYPLLVRRNKRETLYKVERVLFTSDNGLEISIWATAMDVAKPT